jgi:hypothetical protein
MKIIITESQYEMLFKNLPSSIKRRLTPDDFKYFDNNLNKNIHDKLLFTSDFDQFSYNVISQVMHEFVLDMKDDEIETEENPEYGVVYNDESLDEVFERYWKLIPFFEEYYKDKLSMVWHEGMTN